MLLLVVLALPFALDRLFPPPLPSGAGAGAVVLAADGTPLRAFAGRDGVWRYPVTVDEVSPHYVEALLTYEDRWFRHHPGVNPLSLLRAGGQWIANGRVVSGGSTLTMQVARILEPHRRTPLGKLRQALRALQLEWRLDKDQILALYLNHAPFGGTIVGVEAASWAYLGKPASSLSQAEAALLAVLPQAPSRVRPDRHPEAARAARDKVLARMATLDAWTQAQVQLRHLGMHAEVELSMDGTVTIFAGPKGGVSGKIGGAGGDFGVKDGIYAVIGREGVKDVGFRVVVGGGVSAGQGGGTHDVDVMDFSLVSAI